MRRKQGMKGKRRRRQGAVSAVQAGIVPSRTEAEIHTAARRDRERCFHRTKTYNGLRLFSQTETSRNLTKRFRENNNSDLKHQRVI